MTSDVFFPTAVRVTRPDMPPHVLRTVRDAIDLIWSLPEEMQRKPSWQSAIDQLRDADDLRTTRHLNIARAILVQALQQERWL